MGVSEQTFYRWNKKFAGMGVAELRNLKQLEEENRKLNQLVADLCLDKRMLQDVIHGKSKASRFRTLVKRLQTRYSVSECRVCAAVAVPRSSVRYKSVKNDRADLRIRIRDLAATRVHYGYRRLHVLLKREGWTVNHKMVYRIYKDESLTVRRRKPRL